MSGICDPHGGFAGRVRDPVDVTLGASPSLRPHRFASVGLRSEFGVSQLLEKTSLDAPPGRVVVASAVGVGGVRGPCLGAARQAGSIGHGHQVVPGRGVGEYLLCARSPDRAEQEMNRC